MKRALAILLVLASAAALAWGVAARLAAIERGSVDAAVGRPPAPVAVRPVERGPITLRRTFSGTLEAVAELVVAAEIAGRVERLLVDLGDPVERGQVVARLDDAELVQAVHQAEADLAVTKARLAAARSSLEIAERDLERAQKLRREGVASESQLDAARADEVAARAQVELAQAGIPRAEAALESARIRLGHAEITADWNEGDGRRVVAERTVDEGAAVSANATLLSIVELDPILAVVHAPERDYGKITVGQVARLTTDAHPGRTFEARVARIAPVFRRATRQARIELVVPNPDELLKPGMFVRATIELEGIDDAVIVPYDALAERGDESGVFVLDASGERVHWRPVTVGVREGARVQVLGEGVSGKVVVLGQELCDDGGAVTVPDDPGAAPAGGPEGASPSTP